MASSHGLAAYGSILVPVQGMRGMSSNFKKDFVIGITRDCTANPERQIGCLQLFESIMCFLDAWSISRCPEQHIRGVRDEYFRSSTRDIGVIQRSNMPKESGLKAHGVPRAGVYQWPSRSCKIRSSSELMAEFERNTRPFGSALNKLTLAL